MKGDTIERKRIEMLRDDGWSVIRAAGSGQDAPCDLIALKNGKVRIEEVKSRRKDYDKLYFSSPRMKEQWKRLYELNEEGFPAYFVIFWRKGRGKEMEIEEIKVNEPEPPKVVSRNE